MKKWIGIVMIMVAIILVGCSDEGDKVKEEGEGLNKSKIVDQSEGIVKNIYSDMSSKELKSVLEGKKDMMTEETFNTHFNMEELHIQNNFAFGYPIKEWEREDVYVEEMDEVYNVVVIGVATYIDEYVHDVEDHGTGSERYQTTVDTFTFDKESGLIVGYKMIEW